MNSQTLLSFKNVRLAFLLALFVVAGPVVVHAQPILGAQNTALGGGGTAYLGGYEATFWNPANLMIKNRPGNWHVGIGHLGTLYEPVLSREAVNDQFFDFRDSFYPYQPGLADITSAQRNTILENNYPRSRQVSQHQSRSDIILGGALWQRNNEAWSIVARARFASRIEVGRGWYSDAYISSGDNQVRNFTLTQQKNYLYELAVGYAREFTFINGLIPRISKLYIGIAPKIILAGPSFDARYNGNYIRPQDGSAPLFTSRFSYQSTGEYSRMTADYLASGDPQQAINRNLNKKFRLDNTGVGVGFDFGFTYLIPLGDDISTIADTPREAVSEKSLRIAFSVNDIGMVRYTGQPLSLTNPADTLSSGAQPIKESMFIGSDGQYLTYFDSADSLANPIVTAGNPKTSSMSTLLPSSLNAGMMLDLSRLKVMGDLTLGLNNTAFTTTKLAIHLGLEARPLPYLPIRVGTRLASGLPTHLGMGTGIETRYWDLNLGTQIILRSRSFTTEFVGAAVAGLQIHL